MAKKRLYKSILGIPIWAITGISIFLLFSSLYDYFVLDRSGVRYAIIIGSVLIIFITIGLHFISLKFLARQTKKQLGG